MTPENDREGTVGSDAADDQRPDGGARDPASGTTNGAGGPGADGGHGVEGDGAPAAEHADGHADGTADGVDGEVPADAPGESGAEGAAASEPSLEERLAVAESLASTNFERVQRLQAEMENQRKRAQRDVSNARKFALEGIAGDLLPVKDSLELGIRAASAEEASLANLLEGSELTLKMLAQVLEKNAIAEIDPEGEKFDPEFHQAMSMQEVEGVAPNTVTGVMQKGYTLNERLIRPALVMVSK